MGDFLGTETCLLAEVRGVVSEGKFPRLWEWGCLGYWGCSEVRALPRARPRVAEICFSLQS